MNSYTLLNHPAKWNFTKQDKLHGQKLLFTDCFTNSKWQWVNELSTPVTLLKLNQIPLHRII